MGGSDRLKAMMADATREDNHCLSGSGTTHPHFGSGPRQRGYLFMLIVGELDWRPLFILELLQTFSEVGLLATQPLDC